MRLGPLSETGPERAAAIERLMNRRGAIRGPFAVWVRRPGLSDVMERLGTYCTSESALPPRVRELTLLVTARHFDTPHSWNAHVDAAVAAGTEPAALRRLARRREPDFSDPSDRLVHRFVTDLLTGHAVDDDVYAAALERFGEDGLIDLVAAVGTFTLFALALNAFQVDQPDSGPPAFEEPGGARDAAEETEVRR